MRRAQIIAFSGQGMRVQEIAANLEMNEEYLRELIRNFNDEGFDALRQKSQSGSATQFDTDFSEEESLIAEIATAPPCQAFGRPFNQWSLRKLRDFLVEKRLIQPVSHNVIRRVLKNRKITYQRTRTWMSDPTIRHTTLKKTHQSALQEGPAKVLGNLLRRIRTHPGQTTTR